MGDLTYAHEKLLVAVESMATSAATLQDRLYHGYMSFHPLQERDFDDPEMRAQYAQIMAGLTTVKTGPASEGYVKNTLAAMSDDEAERIADLIFSLFMGVVRARRR